MVSLSISCVGLIGIVISGSILFDMWYTRWAWDHSDEHRQAERQLEAASAQWRALDDADEPADGDAEAARTAAPTASAGAADAPVRTEKPVLVPAASMSGAGDSEPPQRVVPGASPTPGVAAAQAEAVVGATFEFLDAPGPEAHAHLTVTLANRSDAPGQPIRLGIPADWFDDYSIIGAIPPVLDDRTEDDGYRYFDFPGAAAGTEVSLELHVKAVGAATAAPTVRLVLRDGEQLGEQQAALVVPPPPPGPVRALSVPRLDIKTSVVDTVWEPPAFVAGQIAKTAPLGAGNSVVVGHRTGRAGDVFSRLIGARLGDQIVAVSNGEEHRYIVSAILRRPGSDITPTQPTETPRVTLMTCVGIWNPLTGDYSERLWVVAEPPDLARATLTATVARASHTAETSASWSEATRARGEALIARAALTLMDAEQRRHR